MKPDRYIRAATAGMPPEQRIERATELKSNLLAHTKRFKAQGYSQKEAEHLAVKAMGPAGVINRAYWFGRFNTLGWIVLWPLLLSAVAFGAWWFLIPKPTGITTFDTNDRSFNQGYRLTLPAGTESAEVAFITVDGNLGIALHPEAFHGKDKARPTYRDQLLISGGVQRVDTESECLDQFELRVGIGVMESGPCLVFAREIDSGSWFGPAPGSGKLESGRWVPIGAFQASTFDSDVPRVEREVGDVFQAIPFEWVGIMVYLGADAPSELLPEYAELPSIFPGLER